MSDSSRSLPDPGIVDAFGKNAPPSAIRKYVWRVRRRYDRRDGDSQAAPTDLMASILESGSRIPCKHASDNEDNVILENTAAAGVDCLDVLEEVMIAVL